MLLATNRFGENGLTAARISTSSSVSVHPSGISANIHTVDNGSSGVVGVNELTGVSAASDMGLSAVWQ